MGRVLDQRTCAWLALWLAACAGEAISARPGPDGAVSGAVDVATDGGRSSRRSREQDVDSGSVSSDYRSAASDLDAGMRPRPDEDVSQSTGAENDGAAGAEAVADAEVVAPVDGGGEAAAPETVMEEPRPKEPPGYTPENLLPDDYDPPSFFGLSLDQKLDVFSRVEAHYVTTLVERGPQVAGIPVSATPIAPVVTWRDQTYDDVTAFMVEARMTGLLVLKDGEIVLERYALGRSAADRWTSFAVAKSLTSLLVGAALQDGAIEGLDDLVTKYIPDLLGSAYRGVTVRHLLTMTSGIQWNGDQADPQSDERLLTDWAGEPDVNPLVSYMRMLPRAAMPGTAFQYKAGDADLAGILVAYATGRGLAEYLSEKIWAPFGMERDAVWVVDRGSVERGGCCLSMTLRDYGRVGLFVLAGGIAGGEQVIDPEYLEQATHNQVQAPAKGNYGYLWWTEDDSYSARGMFGQGIQVVPEEDLVVVTNAAWPAAEDRSYESSQTALLAAVRDAVQ